MRAGRAVILRRGGAIVAGRRVGTVCIGAGGTRGYHALAVELSGMSRSCHSGATVIFGGQHAAITAGLLFVLVLQGGGRDVVLVLGR